MSEKSEVKRDGAKAQKNSGRGDYQKGDAQWKQFLVDYKEAGKSFTLNKDNWAKICTDTFKVNRDMYPALKIILGTDSKVRLGIIEWAILDTFDALATKDDYPKSLEEVKKNWGSNKFTKNSSVFHGSNGVVING
jgi:hypothetical protein